MKPEDLVNNQSVIITLAEYKRLVEFELTSSILAALVVCLAVVIAILVLRRSS